MKNLTSAASICIACALVAPPVFADCGFCAEKVTLNELLAKCYLKRLNDERLAASQNNSEVHLVDLSACGLDRSATALPDVQTDGGGPVQLDQAFLIPEPALDCLAREVETAQFEKDKTLTFEVRVDCSN